MATRKPPKPAAAKRHRTPADRPPGVLPPAHHRTNQTHSAGTQEITYDPQLDPAYAGVWVTKYGHTITPTVTPGVWRNAWQQYVDQEGNLLSIDQLRALNQAADIAILGRPVATPADVMTRIALDPRYSMEMRLEAANKAAPYTDRKQPVSTEIKDLTPPGSVAGMDLGALATLPREEREMFINTLRKLGFGV